MQQSRKVCTANKGVNWYKYFRNNMVPSSKVGHMDTLHSCNSAPRYLPARYARATCNNTDEPHQHNFVEK